MAAGVDFNEAVAKQLEGVYRTEDARRRRRTVIERLAPAPGERIADIGTGPGFLALELADLVGPSGRVVGIDTSEPMLAVARRRCAEKPWVELRTGDASRLPLDDGDFDAAVSVQVYEYIPDVDVALREMHRVLRPGGRAAIISTDWRSVVWPSPDQRRTDEILAAWAEHCAHQDLPRTLAPRLRAVGFELVAEQAIPQFSTRWDLDRYVCTAVGFIKGFAAGRRGITKEQANAWGEEQRRLAEEGKFFACINQFLFVARKP